MTDAQDSAARADHEATKPVAILDESQVYRRNLHAKPDAFLRQIPSVVAQAANYRSLGLSGELTYGWVEAMCFCHHEGDLFNLREDWLNPSGLRPEQLWSRSQMTRSGALQRWKHERWGETPWSELTFPMDELFGGDKRGTMNKFMALSEASPLQTLDAHLAPRLMFLDFAWRIYQGCLEAEPDHTATNPGS